MSEISQTCRCIDFEDKKLMLKVIDETINRETIELRKIQVRRIHDMLKPVFAESFTSIRSSLERVHEDFRKNMEDFKKKVIEYPECEKMLKLPITEIGFNVHKPQGDMPNPYSKRKLF